MSTFIGARRVWIKILDGVADHAGGLTSECCRQSNCGDGKGGSHQPGSEQGFIYFADGYSREQEDPRGANRASEYDIEPAA